MKSHFLTDFLMVILWTVAYVLIIVGGIKYRSERKMFMPLLAGSLNFTWELNALISRGGYGHIAWFTLDIFIMIYNLMIIPLKKCIVYIFQIVVFAFLFKFLFQNEHYNLMLLSSFFIAAIMAIEYLVFAKKISHQLKMPIAVTSCLGNVFAWIGYFQQSVFVEIIGGVTIVLQLIYIAYCLEESSRINVKGKKINHGGIK